MCAFLITHLLRLVGRLSARKPVYHTSWVTAVTPTDRPKSVRNSCVIKLFCGVLCCHGAFLDCSVGVGIFSHRTESDLFLFLLRLMHLVNNTDGTQVVLCFTVLMFYRLYNRLRPYYQILGGFHKIFPTVAASQQRTLTPPDTLSCSIWDLHLF